MVEMMAQTRYWGFHLAALREHHWADSRASLIWMGSQKVCLRAGLKVESLVLQIWKGSRMARY
jgi:hypothetical protein